MNINFEKKKKRRANISTKTVILQTTLLKVRVLLYYFGLFLFKPPIDKLC